jgi:hypothetical protein
LVRPIIANEAALFCFVNNGQGYRKRDWTVNWTRCKLAKQLIQNDITSKIYHVAERS